MVSRQACLDLGEVPVMPGPHLTAAELADELGRSSSWIYEHWKRLCKSERLPHPLHAAATPLIWSRAQVYAWLDRDLDKAQRIAAQAYRAAAAAAASTPHVSAHALADDAWRAKLDTRFANGDQP
jgi:predicted DNA-binding transcriptional regulator AlpA